LDLGYDGTNYAGWARQSWLRNVQEVLERGLATVLRLDDAVHLTCAGRTDAGVHARGQVAHVDVPPSSYAALRDQGIAGGLTRRLAGVLPADVRVFRARGAPPAFHARFSALSRRYIYRVSDAPFGVEPLRRHDVLWSQQPLDVPVMNQAAVSLLGEHDFAAFCRRREGATTVRTLLMMSWERDVQGVATATVEADAFCHNMVRSMVGALLAVGRGQHPVEWPAELLARRRRDPAVQVAAPHGLTLEHVSYPSESELGLLGARARRRRGTS
jgi:tRNA pseudouridine38-40 synthase